MKPASMSFDLFLQSSDIELGAELVGTELVGAELGAELGAEPCVHSIHFEGLDYIVDLRY
mgnify:CR=1 FL=1